MGEHMRITCITVVVLGSLVIAAFPHGDASGPTDACAGVVLGALTGAPTPNSHLFADNFSSGLAAWNVRGNAALADCTAGAPAPSLLISPVCCNSYERVAHVMNLALTAPTTFSFAFNGAVGPSTDADFVLQSPTADAMYVALTGGASNHVLTLVANDHGRQNLFPFFTWADQTWYTVTLHVDPLAHSYRADVADVSGNFLAHSPVMGIPAGFGSVSFVSFQGVSYQQEVGAMRFDNVVVDLDADPAPSAAIIDESFGQGLAAWTVTGSGASIDCATGTPACSLVIGPTCCNTYTQVGKYGLAAALSRPLVATFDFTGNGDPTTDGDFVLGLVPGDSVNLHLSGGSSNRDVLLHTIDHGVHTFSPLFTWTTGAWYHASLYVDPLSGTSRAEVRSTGGALLATSGTQALPMGEPNIEALVMQDIAYGSSTGSHHYDSVSLRYAS